jgi:hypothetical protein
MDKRETSILAVPWPDASHIEPGTFLNGGESLLLAKNAVQRLALDPITLALANMRENNSLKHSSLYPTTYCCVIDAQNVCNLRYCQ